MHWKTREQNKDHQTKIIQVEQRENPIISYKLERNEQIRSPYRGKTPKHRVQEMEQRRNIEAERKIKKLEKKEKSRRKRQVKNWSKKRRIIVYCKWST